MKRRIDEEVSVAELAGQLASVRAELTATQAALAASNARLAALGGAHPPPGPFLVLPDPRTMDSASLLSTLTTDLAACGPAPASDALVLKLSAILSALAAQGCGAAAAAAPGLVPAVLAACASQPRAHSVRLALAKALGELSSGGGATGAALLAQGALPLMVDVGLWALTQGHTGPHFNFPAAVLQAPGALLALRDALAAHPWAAQRGASASSPVQCCSTSVPGKWLSWAAHEEGVLAVAGLLQAAAGGASVNLTLALARAASTLRPSTEAVAAQALGMQLGCLPWAPALLPWLLQAYSREAWEGVGQAARLAAAPHIIPHLHTVQDLPALLAVVGAELQQAWPQVQAQALAQLQEQVDQPQEDAEEELKTLLLGASRLMPHLAAGARAAASQALGAHLAAALSPGLPTAYALLQALALPGLHPALADAVEAALAAGSVPSLCRLLSPLFHWHPHSHPLQLQLSARDAALLTAALQLSSSSAGSEGAVEVIKAVAVASAFCPTLLHAGGHFEALATALRACLARSKQAPLAAGAFEELQVAWSLLLRGLHASIGEGVPGAAGGGRSSCSGGRGPGGVPGGLLAWQLWAQGVCAGQSSACPCAGVGGAGRAGRPLRAAAAVAQRLASAQL